MSGTVGTLTREVYDRWLAELEVRPKGAGALRSLCDDRVTGECCLGVLADVIDPDGWDGDVFRSYWHGQRWDLRDGYEGPTVVAGLRTGLQSYLIALNDSSMTFEPVIAYIKAHIEPVEDAS